MQSVTSNAVAGAINTVQDIIRGGYSQKFKVLVSGYYNTINWGAGIFGEEGYHSYLVIAQRLSTNHTYMAVVHTSGASGNKQFFIKEIANDGFRIDSNELGTFELIYQDSSNKYNYTIFVVQIA